MQDRFLVEQRPVVGPATHAIVIGVGAYPHLLGGSGTTVADPDGMSQLTSPPHSARAVARWLIASLHDPRKPLADVSLLVAEERPRSFRNPRTRVDVPVAVATIDEIEAALTAWRARGNASENDRLILYFCGHGIARGSDVALLASDFGAKPANALDGAIDFRSFMLGMDGCAAREQLYFIDACRASSDTLLRADQYRGRPIFQPNLGAPARAFRRAPVFYSTLAGAQAYGIPRRPSPFTEALIRGLNGAGADDSEGEWRITTTRLKEALDFYVERATRGVGRAQVPAADNAAPVELHVVRGTPRATVIVACDPGDATGAADLAYRTPRGVRARPARDGAEWIVELPVGMYEFTADFDGPPFQPARSEAYVRPVYRRVPLKVQS